MQLKFHKYFHKLPQYIFSVVYTRALHNNEVTALP